MDSALLSLSAFASARLLVVGDIMLDRFIDGDVHRLSPESPVPILTIKRETHMLGGAGNVLRNLAGLGAGSALVALVGDDGAADTVIDLVRACGTDPAGTVRDASRLTTIKTRFRTGTHQLLRTDAETPHPLAAPLRAELLSIIKEALPRCGAVILSDYGKGMLDAELIATVIALARAASIPVLVDPKGHDYSRYRGATLVTPNRKELSDASGGAPTLTDDDVTQAARTIINTCGIDGVLATRSGDGMTLVRAGDPDPIHFRATAREVFDVSGAGDTVIAVIGAALAAGKSLADGALLANIAGGIVVGKIGTAPIRIDELRQAVDAQIDTVHDHALLSWDQMAERVRRWQATGLRVGFTNGCFDLLHAGHVTYLAAARTQCDRLIVGLNADASVTRLKGPSRPLNRAADRATTLRALRVIDGVVLFGDTPSEGDKPLALIERLKPDVYVKGGDYTTDTLPETPLVQSYGGVVKIMPFVEGLSTTALLKKAG